MTNTQLQEITLKKDEILMDLDNRLENIFAEEDIKLTARRKDDIKIMLSKINDKVFIDVLRAYEEATDKFLSEVAEIALLKKSIEDEKKKCEELTSQAKLYKESLETQLKNELSGDPKVLNAFILAKQLCAITNGKKDKEISAIEHIVCTYLGGKVDD